MSWPPYDRFKKQINNHEIKHQKQTKTETAVSGTVKFQ